MIQEGHYFLSGKSMTVEVLGRWSCGVLMVLVSLLWIPWAQAQSVEEAIAYIEKATEKRAKMGRVLKEQGEIKNYLRPGGIFDDVTIDIETSNVVLEENGERIRFTLSDIAAFRVKQIQETDASFHVVEGACKEDSPCILYEEKISTPQMSLLYFSGASQAQRVANAFNYLRKNMNMTDSFAP